MKDRDLWEAKARTMIGFNDIYSFHERIIKIVLQTNLSNHLMLKRIKERAEAQKV